MIYATFEIVWYDNMIFFSYEWMNSNFVFLLRGEIKEYLPPQEEVRRNIEEIYTFCVGQVAAMHSLTPQETKTKFIGEWYLPNHITDAGNDDDGNGDDIFLVNYCLSEILTTLPLFSANIFLAQKVSQRGCPSPCMASISQEGVLFLHPATQVTSEDFSFMFPLGFWRVWPQMLKNITLFFANLPSIF